MPLWTRLLLTGPEFFDYVEESVVRPPFGRLYVEQVLVASLVPVVSAM